MPKRMKEVVRAFPEPIRCILIEAKRYGHKGSLSDYRDYKREIEKKNPTNEVRGKATRELEKILCI